MRKVAIIFMKKCSVLLLMLLFPLGVLAQSVTVSGQVTDEAGEPIIGASVRIPGTSVGVVTDMDGNYSISVPKGKQLEITYVGYKKEVIIAKEGKMTVQLKEDSNMLNEVVAIGYGTVKRKDVTGSVSSVGNTEPCRCLWLRLLRLCRVSWLVCVSPCLRATPTPRSSSACVVVVLSPATTHLFIL